MTLDKYFTKFLTDIEPSRSTKDEIKRIHSNLREFLSEDDDCAAIVDSTFLSGSYAKNTSIRPVLNDGKRDVDIDIVTNFTMNDDPAVVLEKIEDLLHKQAKYSNTKKQSHSICVEMSGLNVDVVPLIREDDSSYYIGSRDNHTWSKATPKEHIQWSSDVNAENNMKYKPLVKLFKWWRRENCPDGVRFPKGIALEVIVADNIGNVSQSTEDLLIDTMRSIVSRYRGYVVNGFVPFLQDPAMTDNDLLSRTSFDDFQKFIGALENHLSLIDDEGRNNVVWKKIFGERFPSDNKKSLDLESYKTVSYRQVPPWSLPHKPSVTIKATVVFPNDAECEISSDDFLLPKGSSIKYMAAYPITSKDTVKWQIVNTGKEAELASCLRGGFENSNNFNSGPLCRIESTAYTGKHYVQCFIVRNGCCIAYSDEFFINVE
ncbi:hypothetical protein BBIA_0603 [Bifidobacterium biavatii DSM 23969]|uniref:Adenylyl/Guanylyl and SMODS C-terminal sensor domain-containing protein n=2 Tax=Bifidobacterium biavatii TaxID=762212 RepID=A0A087A0K4_9BIFI|nr:hypothetical protein BBIA_0603 [Bifidobacterium biavatii DSM 23969]